VTASGTDSGGGLSFDVGIAIHPSAAIAAESAVRSQAGGRSGESAGLAGYDEVIGLIRQRAGDRRLTLIEKGEDAVRAGTEAIAGQIGIAAQRIAAVLDQQDWTPATENGLGLESVQVAFGVTLSGGVQAVFTSAVESSAQVTITLTRRRADGHPAATDRQQ
jgi:hypothetical protein